MTVQWIVPIGWGDMRVSLVWLVRSARPMGRIEVVFSGVSCSQWDFDGLMSVDWRRVVRVRWDWTGEGGGADVGLAGLR